MIIWIIAGVVLGTFIIVIIKQTVSGSKLRKAYKHNSLGLNYCKINMYKEAIIEFKKAIRIDPSIPSFYVSMGDTYQEMGEYENASDAYKRGIKRDPTNKQIFKKISEVSSIMKRQGIKEKLKKKRMAKEAAKEE